MFSDVSGYDSDEVEEYVNETPLPEIDSNFRTKMLNCKNALYEVIIFSGQEGTESAQDNKLLQVYLKSIDKLYSMSKLLQNRSTNQIPDLSEFPEKAREPIKMLFEWIRQFFINNSIPDTIPYTDYIRKSLHEYPFVRVNSFEDD